MDHIRHRAAVGDADVAGDHRTTKARRHEIAVVHSSAADDPGCLVGQTADDEGMLGFGQVDGRVEVVNLDPGAVGGGEAALATGKTVRIAGQDADGAWGFGGPLLNADAEAMAAQDRDFGVVGRVDAV